MPSKKNEHMDKLIIGTIFILTFQHAKSQDITAENKIKSIQSLYYSVDTVQSKDKNSLTVDIKWMDSVIQIRKTTRVKYDIDEARKFRRDSTYTPSLTDTLRVYEMRKIFSQNCHSYALEKYFKNAGLNDELLFTEKTVLTENMYMDKILVTAFEKINSFETKRKKCKDCNFSIGSIIVFRNKWNWPIHTVYYDGKFHSKYGGWAAKAEDTVDIILKAYWDTTTIEEYKLDDKKIRHFIDRGQKGS